MVPGGGDDRRRRRRRRGSGSPLLLLPRIRVVRRAVTSLLSHPQPRTPPPHSPIKEKIVPVIANR